MPWRKWLFNNTPMVTLPSPDPETLARLVTLEQAFGEIFQDRKRYAAQITELLARLSEQDRTIARVQSQYQESESRRLELTAAITERVREIGALEAQIKANSASHQRQGTRLGELETQVQYLTAERASAATVAQQAQAEVYFLTEENLLLRAELARCGVDLTLVDQRLAEIREQLRIQAVKP
jgi:chromosome segregation ATPase